MKQKFTTVALFLIDLTVIPVIVIGYYKELIKDAYNTGISCYNRNK